MANVLLSYPRAANSWVRYFVEVVTGLPSSQGTYTDSTSNNPKSDALVHKSMAKPAVIIKRHRFDFEWDKWDENRDTLLVLVRDYKECIIRNNDALCNQPKYQKQSAEAYMHVIKTYHDWKGPKLMVFYEDLLIEPKRELARIAKHLELDGTKAQLFYDDLSQHKTRSIQLYHPGSATQGTAHKLHFHSRRKSQAAQKISVLVAGYPPYLYDYVKRYK